MQTLHEMPGCTSYYSDYTRSTCCYLSPDNNQLITSSLPMSCPCFTNNLTTSTWSLKAAQQRAFSPLCNIMHQVTIVQTVAVVEFHLQSDVGISFSLQENNDDICITARTCSHQTGPAILNDKMIAIMIMQMLLYRIAETFHGVQFSWMVDLLIPFCEFNFCRCAHSRPLCTVQSSLFHGSILFFAVFTIKLDPSIISCYTVFYSCHRVLIRSKYVVAVYNTGTQSAALVPMPIHYHSRDSGNTNQT